jgi:uncharacterized membrane protein
MAAFKDFHPSSGAPPDNRRSRRRDITRVGAGLGMIVASTGHLTFARQGFQAQVPDWVPVDKDTTVLMSGVVEIAVGAAVIGLPRYRESLGRSAGGIAGRRVSGQHSQYTGRRDGLGLNTDRKRAVRLAFQPLMVAAAWRSTRDRASS